LLNAVDGLDTQYFTFVDFTPEPEPPKRIIIVFIVAATVGSVIASV